MPRIDSRSAERAEEHDARRIELRPRQDLVEAIAHRFDVEDRHARIDGGSGRADGRQGQRDVAGGPGHDNQRLRRTRRPVESAARRYREGRCRACRARRRRCAQVGGAASLARARPPAPDRRRLGRTPRSRSQFAPNPRDRRAWFQGRQRRCRQACRNTPGRPARSSPGSPCQRCRW